MCVCGGGAACSTVGVLEGPEGQRSEGLGFRAVRYYYCCYLLSVFLLLAFSKLAFLNQWMVVSEGMERFRVLSPLKGWRFLA